VLYKNTIRRSQGDLPPKKGGQANKGSMYDITVLVRVSALAIVYAMQVRPTAPAANNNVAKVDHAAGCAKHGEAPGSQ